jgi:hypothetical protein
MRRSRALLMTCALALAASQASSGCRAATTTTPTRQPSTSAAVLDAAAPGAAATRDGFRATISSIDGDLAEEMTGASWREGCPVPLADLRLVEVRHWDFAGDQRVGELVVHRDVVRAAARGFRGLYRAGFPIRSMQRVDAFDGSDEDSMAADNTSAFNCRAKTGSTTSWSVHSFGRAIDINPVENPYVSGATVLPPAGRAWLDRADVRPGMIVAGNAVIAAFPGWDWGGDWRRPRDYQHLERPLVRSPERS